ncbi:NAD-dependent epimerase/dehydratase family protein, partial [Cryobacterium sp.]
MKILVTGGAGFIGSNFVRRTLQDAYPGLEGAEVVVLDALTYSGNLENLAPVADSPRYSFVQGDIRDGALLDTLFPGLDAVVHF